MTALIIYVDQNVHSTRYLPDPDVDSTTKEQMLTHCDGIAVLAAGYKEFAGLLKSLVQGTLRRYDGWSVAELVIQEKPTAGLKRETPELPEGSEVLMTITAPIEKDDDAEEPADPSKPNSLTRESLAAMSKAQLIEVLQAHGVEDKDIDKKAKHPELLASTIAVVFADL